MQTFHSIKLLAKRCLTFAVFAGVLYVCLLFLSGFLPKRLTRNLQYRRASLGNTLTRLTQAKETRDVDILFLGSSHAYRGFDPRIFASQGYKSFNLGTSAQTAFQTKVLIERYLDQLNPKLVVYEVYGGSFTFDGTEASLDVISNDSNDKHSLELALRQKNPKVWNTLLYSELRTLFGLAEVSEPRVRYGETYIDGGYIERYQRTHRVPHGSETWNIRNDQFEVFQSITKKIKDRGIQLILVQAPISPSRYKTITNADEFDQKMSREGTYVNFNKIISLDDSLHFYDTHHLNQYGVQKFDSAFLKYLSGLPQIHAK